MDGIDVYGVSNLRQALEPIFSDQAMMPEPRREIFASLQGDSENDFTDVRGQHHVKRAIVSIASVSDISAMEGIPNCG